MPEKLELEVVREVVKLALLGQDHRDVVTRMIDRRFLNQSVEFLMTVAEAKSRSTFGQEDWYRKRIVEATESKSHAAWFAGTNVKTVDNKRGSSRFEVVLEEAILHLDQFRKQVHEVLRSPDLLQLRLNINGATVQLDIEESVVVINALAVMRAGLRGGAWSSVGKQVEAPLMETLCRVFKVPERHFSKWSDRDQSEREVDFFLVRGDGSEAKCEVKLLGRGNPENTDAVPARNINTFVVSTLSDSTRKRLNEQNVAWTELQTQNGILRFQLTLGGYGVPFTEISGSEIESEVERALTETFSARTL